MALPALERARELRREAVDRVRRRDRDRERVADRPDRRDPRERQRAREGREEQEAKRQRMREETGVDPEPDKEIARVLAMVDDPIEREPDCIDMACELERHAMREEERADFELGPVEREPDLVDALTFDQHELVDHRDGDFDVVDDVDLDGEFADLF